MSLRVYDTRRRAKLPYGRKPGERAGIYVCGMTVQDRPHVGHMRAAISGDVIRRWLLARGYDVVYVTNFTDIDDKIIARANEEGVPYGTVSRRNEQAFLEYARRLNLMPIRLVCNTLFIDVMLKKKLACFNHGLFSFVGVCTCCKRHKLLDFAKYATF